MPGDGYDLAIIGGGINGAGIAADAAGRGLKVVLLERDDLGGGTSSASSKLVHGGLRYLEHGAFRLVRESLGERQVLLARAPHLVQPLRFVIPHAPGMRHRALMRLGLLLYDRLSTRRSLPNSRAIDLSQDAAGTPLRDGFKAGFTYYDCTVDDARLVVTMALDAAERGARIMTRTQAVAAERGDDAWRITAETASGTITLTARALVNAAGPWCAEIAHRINPASGAPAVRLVRGTHIVVPRIRGAHDAYLLQNDDRRVVFALPFEGDFTLIGTTEIPVSSPDDGFIASDAETDYLLDAARRFFSHPMAVEDVIWRFAGVRALVDDGARTASALSRDYRIDLAWDGSGPALLTIVGGKITTFRSLADAALARLAPCFPGMGRAWTADAPLPGGDFGEGGAVAFGEALSRRRRGFAQATLTRLAALYGTRAERLLGDAQSDGDLGASIGGGLTAREVLYLRDNEWARTAEDVLWRRTKAGLHIGEGGQERAAEQIAALLAS